MKLKDQQIARIYYRLLDQRTEGWEEAEAQDAQFDGGEWSSPAWGRNWQRAEEEVMAILRDRFGLTSGQISDLIMEYDYFQADCFYRALDDRSGPSAMGYSS